MYVHHADGAPQIIHMECSPIRRNAERRRTAHFDQVTPGEPFRTLADESPLSLVGDGDESPVMTKKTKIKRGRATPPQHKLPILFF